MASSSCDVHPLSFALEERKLNMRCRKGKPFGLADVEPVSHQLWISDPVDPNGLTKGCVFCWEDDS